MIKKLKNSKKGSVKSLKQRQKKGQPEPQEQN